MTIGAPEVLVNMAGMGVSATVLETSDEDWSRVLSVNLTSPFLTTRAMLPLMLDRGSGVIVNIASVGGLVGLVRRAAYCASTAGLIGLTKAIAVDHAREGMPLRRDLPRPGGRPRGGGSTAARRSQGNAG